MAKHNVLDQFSPFAKINHYEMVQFIACSEKFSVGPGFKLFQIIQLLIIIN